MLKLCHQAYIGWSRSIAELLATAGRRGGARLPGRHPPHAGAADRPALLPPRQHHAGPLSAGASQEVASSVTVVSLLRPLLERDEDRLLKYRLSFGCLERFKPSSYSIQGHK